MLLMAAPGTVLNVRESHGRDSVALPSLMAADRQLPLPMRSLDVWRQVFS